jgi:hypothetical protein
MIGLPLGAVMPAELNDPQMQITTPRLRTAACESHVMIWSALYSEKGSKREVRRRRQPSRDQNEGVGEHVRIRSHRGLTPWRDCRPNIEPAPNEENLFLLPDRHTGSKAA